MVSKFPASAVAHPAFRNGPFWSLDSERNLALIPQEDGSVLEVPFSEFAAVLVMIQEEYPCPTCKNGTIAFYDTTSVPLRLSCDTCQTEHILIGDENSEPELIPITPQGLPV